MIQWEFPLCADRDFSVGKSFKSPLIWALSRYPLYSSRSTAESKDFLEILESMLRHCAENAWKCRCNCKEVDLVPLATRMYYKVLLSIERVVHPFRIDNIGPTDPEAVFPPRIAAQLIKLGIVYGPEEDRKKTLDNFLVWLSQPSPPLELDWRHNTNTSVATSYRMYIANMQCGALYRKEIMRIVLKEDMFSNVELQAALVDMCGSGSSYAPVAELLVDHGEKQLYRILDPCTQFLPLDIQRLLGSFLFSTESISRELDTFNWERQ